MQRWAWLALIVGLTLGLSSQPAQAQYSCPDGTGVLILDWSYANGLLTSTPFVEVVDQQGVIQFDSLASSQTSSAVAAVDLRVPGHDVRHVTFGRWFNSAANNLAAIYHNGSTIAQATDGNGSYPVQLAWSWDGTNAIGAGSFIGLYARHIAGSAWAGITDLAICGVPAVGDVDLVRPIAAGNAHPWGIYGQSAFASSPGKPVHSPANGHISTLRRATTSDCSAFGMVDYGWLSSYCTITLPSPATILTFDVTTGKIGVAHPAERIWIVSVTASTGTYTYMVANADLYVSVGQTVSAGCVLGQTMRVDTGVEVLDGYNEDEFFPFGVAGVPDEAFTDEPNTLEPCNGAPENRGCLGDNALTDRAQWESGGGAIWEQPGYRLPPGGYLQATYILDSSRDPRMSAIVRPMRATGHGPSVGPSDMRLQLGMTVRTLELSANEDSDYDNWQTLSIPAGPHPPDLQGFWTVRLENISPGWVQVNTICVTLGADVDPPEPPGPGGGNPPPPAPPSPASGERTAEGACGGSIPYPQAGNESLASWITWLWARQSQFFRCDLIRVLRSIQETVGNFARTVGFSVRWNMAVIQATLNWMDRQLLPWLAGYMANMQPSTVTVASGCNSFWCALASILGNIINGIIAPIVGLIVDLIGMAAQLLGQILSGIIDLIFSFINAAMTLLNIARVAFAALLDAWINTEPAEIPGWATCPSSPDASSPLCILFWVLENTAFTHAGALIIPLLTGWFSLHLILWFVGDIKQTFIKLGQGT